jgi:hypothetical protein
VKVVVAGIMWETAEASSSASKKTAAEQAYMYQITIK